MLPMYYVRVWWLCNDDCEKLLCDCVMTVQCHCQFFFSSFFFPWGSPLLGEIFAYVTVF